jgi:NADH-quinone oxidoreductase subunit L
MFLAVGVGAFTAGMFHLVTHAFFKALLFLAAGGVIHALGGEEDLHRMGGLKRHLPGMYWSFLIGALALAGFPLLSGFFSKDEIIFAAFASERGNVLLGALALVGVAMTGFYVFRAFLLAFHGDSHRAAHQHIHVPGSVMALPVGLLAVLAAVGGYLNYIGGAGAVDRFLEPVFHRYTQPIPEVHGAEGLQMPLMVLSVGLGLAGIGLAYLMYVKHVGWAAVMGEWAPALYKLFLNKWYVDELYAAIFVRPAKALGRMLESGPDELFTEGLVRGVSGGVRTCSMGLRRLQSGYLRDYALGIIAGAALVLVYLLQSGGAR